MYNTDIITIFLLQMRKLNQRSLVTFSITQLPSTGIVIQTCLSPKCRSSCCLERPVFSLENRWTRKRNQELKFPHTKINIGPWLVQLSGYSMGLRTNRLPVQFPLRAHAWVAGQVPSKGCSRGNHTLMFLSLFLFPFHSLKIINKSNL